MEFTKEELELLRVAIKTTTQLRRDKGIYVSKGYIDLYEKVVDEIYREEDE